MPQRLRSVPFTTISSLSLSLTRTFWLAHSARLPIYVRCRCDVQHFNHQMLQIAESTKSHALLSQKKIFSLNGKTFSLNYLQSQNHVQCNIAKAHYAVRASQTEQHKTLVRAIAENITRSRQ